MDMVKEMFSVKCNYCKKQYSDYDLECIKALARDGALRDGENNGLVDVEWLCEQIDLYAQHHEETVDKDGK